MNETEKRFNLAKEDVEVNGYSVSQACRSYSISRTCYYRHIKLFYKQTLWEKIKKLLRF